MRWNAEAGILNLDNVTWTRAREHLADHLRTLAEIHDHCDECRGQYQDAFRKLMLATSDKPFTAHAVGENYVIKPAGTDS